MKTLMNYWPLLFSATPLLQSCGEKAISYDKPNIIYIMSDDHTSQAVGVYGSRLAKLNPTPTIDRIGNEGMIFDNAFCTNSISTPSRACIITGQYSQKNGVLDLNDSLPIAEQYLPQEIKKLGYQTAIVGKWHLKNAPESFDYYNVFYGQGSYFNPVLYEKNSKDSVLFYNHAKKAVVPGHKYIGHSSDIVMDITLDWLKNKRDKSKPFFLCHQFKAPHDLFEYNPRYTDYLAHTEIPEPASLYDNKNNGSIGTKGVDDKLIHIIGSSVGHRNVIRNMGMHMGIYQSIPDPQYKHQAYQEYLKRYLRCVKGVDDNVKRLFDYLEKEGLMDNTIIVYTGDQGFMLGEHDYIDKRWMYDESMRMPFLVRYPKKIKAGSHSKALINNTDFAPTLIELAGGKKPTYMQGESFKDILYTGQEPANWRKATYYRYWMHMAHRHNNPGHFGLRTKAYKLIFFYGIDYKQRPDKFSQRQTPAAWEFYDLRKDPHEMDNRYNDPTYKEVISKLKEQLKTQRKTFNEGDQKYPEIEKIIDQHWND
ncbi:MAG: sulfatase [Massilibacteroides sp.]|nr:sulfatase [Massilibacteroides sp.]